MYRFRPALFGADSGLRERFLLYHRRVRLFRSVCACGGLAGRDRRGWFFIDLPAVFRKYCGNPAPACNTVSCIFLFYGRFDKPIR